MSEAIIPYEPLLPFLHLIRETDSVEQIGLVFDEKKCKIEVELGYSLTQFFIKYYSIFNQGRLLNWLHQAFSQFKSNGDIFDGDDAFNIKLLLSIARIAEADEHHGVGSDALLDALKLVQTPLILEVKKLCQRLIRQVLLPSGALSPAIKAYIGFDGLDILYQMHSRTEIHFELLKGYVFYYLNGLEKQFKGDSPLVLYNEKPLFRFISALCNKFLHQNEKVIKKLAELEKLKNQFIAERPHFKGLPALRKVYHDMYQWVFSDLTLDHTDKYNGLCMVIALINQPTSYDALNTLAKALPNYQYGIQGALGYQLLACLCIFCGAMLIAGGIAQATMIAALSTSIGIALSGLALYAGGGLMFFSNRNRQLSDSLQELCDIISKCNEEHNEFEGHIYPVI